MADANGLVSGHAYTITKVMTVCATYLQYPVHDCSSSSYFCSLRPSIRHSYTVTFIVFPLLPLLAFSHYFSSSSAFLRSLFTQSSRLNCGLPRFLQPLSLFVPDIFGNLSSFILNMCPAHFIHLINILPTMQALVPTSSLRSFILLPANLLIKSSCFRVHVVCLDAVRTELPSLLCHP